VVGRRDYGEKGEDAAEGPAKAWLHPWGSALGGGTPGRLPVDGLLERFRSHRRNGGSPVTFSLPTPERLSRDGGGSNEGFPLRPERIHVPGLQEAPSPGALPVLPGSAIPSKAAASCTISPRLKGCHLDVGPRASDWMMLSPNAGSHSGPGRAGGSLRFRGCFPGPGFLCHSGPDGDDTTASKSASRSSFLVLWRRLPFRGNQRRGR